MPSEKTLEPVQFCPTVICFGDITRDEINGVLKEAGISLIPPSKTPFATGIRRRRRRKSKSKVINKTSTTTNNININTTSDISPSSPSDKTQTIKRKQTTSETSNTTKQTSSSSTIATTTTQSTSGTAPTSKTTTTTPTPTTPTATPATPSSPATPPPQQQQPAKPKPNSWAALLQTNTNKSKPASPNTTSQQTRTVPTGNQPVSVVPLKKFTGIADIINQYEPTTKTPLLEPRGLINNVNTCFMNVILQPLSHCPPFYNLIKTIGQHVVHNFKSQTPLLDSLIEFINEYRIQGNDIEALEPFVPEYVYDALRGQKRFDSLKGRQEDAEEFLCFLLDGLHEEMVSVVKEQMEKHEAEERKRLQVNGNNQNGWMEVGPKNKTATLRTTGFDDSPIKKIFGGTGRSVLRCPGAKDSVTIEPYQSLPLDIQPESVYSIEDAIRNMTLPETMHDYMSPSGERVDATKQIYLENLPPVLILHVKRFVFDNVGGVQKLRKQVTYSSKMTIQPDWMARSSSPVIYQLFGVVYHHGTSAGGGHYTCDIKRQNGEWLHIDDTNIVPVKEEDVLVTEQNTRTNEPTDQNAYILFYMKC
ncbi:unnamed protein product [Cunninghamella echinulata]